MQELVYSTIQDISSAVLIADDVENPSESGIYANEKLEKTMASMQNEHAKTGLLARICEALGDISQDGSYTLDDFELQGRNYSLSLSRTGNRLFALFTEVSRDSIVETISYRELSKSCSSIVIIIGDQGQLVDANDCFLGLVGMTREEAVGKPFFQTFIPGDITLLGRYMQEILEKEHYHRHFVTPLRSAHDKTYRINWHVSKIQKQGETYMFVVGNDISKFLDENDKLKKELISIKVGFQYFPLGIAYFGSSGELIEANPRFNQMMGLKTEAAKTHFDDIAPLHGHFSFETMQERLGLIKDYRFKQQLEDKFMQVDIRLLQGKKEHSKLFITVCQYVKSRESV